MVSGWRRRRSFTQEGDLLIIRVQRIEAMARAVLVAIASRLRVRLAEAEVAKPRKVVLRQLLDASSRTLAERGPLRPGTAPRPDPPLPLRSAV